MLLTHWLSSTIQRLQSSRNRRAYARKVPRRQHANSNMRLVMPQQSEALEDRTLLAAGYTVTETGANTLVGESGTTDTFDVVLDEQPLTGVVIAVSSGDAGEVTVDQGSRIFTNTNWDIVQTVTVTGIDDVTVDGDQVTSVTLSIDKALSDDAFDFVADETVSVTTTDDDSRFIGVDFGGGLLPPNWTAFPSAVDGTLSNLIDEGGAATGIDLTVVFDNLPGNTAAFSPLAAELPMHTRSLAGLDGNYGDQGSVQLTLSKLAPGLNYDVYVFAGDTFSDTQQVTITDEAAGGTVLTTFTQTHASGQLIINSEVGDSSRTLRSYGIPVTADANGEININIDSTGGTFLGLAGLAIEPPSPPDELVLNEVLVELPSGSDNPNEYIELRGTANAKLNDVYLAFVDGSGQIRSGASHLIDLSGNLVGDNGFVAIVDEQSHPYSVAPGTTIVDVPGLDVTSSVYTAFLIHVDPAVGTAPFSGQDLDTDDNGLDAIPSGWTILDGVGRLDGNALSRSYAPIAYSPDGDGLTDSVLVTTGFGGAAMHIMRAGDTTGSRPADWVAFQLSDTAPNLTVAASTDPSAYNAGAIITNHLGESNPTSAATPLPGLTLTIAA
ncbi:MAG: hypothetical protein ABGZ35_13285, partial [Planctomycetaceae bacterium]